MPRTGDANKISNRRVQEFRGQLLDWYGRHARALPWRAGKGRKPDPYHVWLSEIMCQQTTVAAAGPYFTKFLQKWPDIHAMAKAPIEDIMKEWAGLGYYARARNLHACAKVVSKGLKGQFPDSQKALKDLPGIGDYTSAAIMAIVHNYPATVVDGNVERVVARYLSVEDPLPASKPLLKQLAGQFFKNAERPGDLAQAFMDLGATICIPKAPRCGLCPVAKHCQASIQGIAAELPAKTRAKARPQKYGHVYWIENKKGEVLLQRRPEKGMLGGMIGLPTSEWTKEKNAPAGTPIFLSGQGIRDISRKPFKIRHTFTHFDLELTLKTAKPPARTAKSEGYFWAGRKNIEEAGFPSVFGKAVNVFLHK